MSFLAIDHVQLAMPPGSEVQATDFYAGVLGLDQLVKPEPMQASGGAWFRSGGVEVHLGIEVDFRPGRKAHPAFHVDHLDALAGRCEAAGHQVQWDDRFPGVRRFYVHDPFGNRLEMLDPIADRRSPPSTSG